MNKKYLVDKGKHQLVGWEGDSFPAGLWGPRPYMVRDGVLYKVEALKQCSYIHCYGSTQEQCPTFLDGPKTYCCEHEMMMRERAARDTQAREAATQQQKKLAGQIRRFLGGFSQQELEALVKKYNLNTATAEEDEDE